METANKKLTRKEKIAQGIEKTPKRKTARAQKLREKREDEIKVTLRNHSIAPRKMRLVADLIRGREVFEALNILKFTSKAGAPVLAKLLKAAVASYYEKSDGDRVDVGTHYIKSITVDSAGMLKRIRPAPQGRAHLIRKRSSHTTLIIEEIPEEEYFEDEA